MNYLQNFFLAIKILLGIPTKILSANLINFDSRLY